MSRNPTNSFLSVLCRLRQLLFTDFDHVYLLVSKTGCKNTKIFSESYSFMHFSFTSYCFFVVFTSEIYCLCHYRVQSNPRWRQEFAADRKRIQRGVTVKPVEFLLVPDFLILNRSLAYIIHRNVLEFQELQEYRSSDVSFVVRREHVAELLSELLYSCNS